MTAATTSEPTPPRPRTPAKRKARELAKHLRGERPDYTYLKEVFRHLRAELDGATGSCQNHCPGGSCSAVTVVSTCGTIVPATDTATRHDRSHVVAR